MKRALRVPKISRPQGSVCQFCQLSTSVPRRALPLVRLPVNAGSRVSQPRSIAPPLVYTPPTCRRYATGACHAESAIQKVAQEASALRDSDRVPSNEAVVELLEKCHTVAQDLLLRDNDESTSSEEGNAISSLLGMEESKAARAAARANSSPSLDPRLADSITRVGTEVLMDEKVFISPEALQSYTTTQVLLGRVEHCPEIFRLYANKPVPEEDSSPIKFHKADPKNVNSAVPTELATLALDMAISQKNLSLVLAIIDNAFCAPAFHRAKVFKKAGVPLVGLAAAPAACYALASMASSFQTTMDPSTATGIAFAASLAYVGGTASMGILAITTANDQMERVVWLPGIPLRQRWLREEERAAMDKVALAWGFKDPSMRGEEVGEEWEALREFIGMRGMILDKTELMEGME
ncbi:hypothetical protein N7492_006928 [Penicillium capsulatum]|uniref:Uncharacterized protein n=1 Tax=Penicillium capsulatum TaxID=69766 RepID=A0A9W9LLM0_9EURO|nr:hypothetical protein N7492_006928 [Penicillium capsulatum]KAJ6116761.1 hypothetical protein N7512_006486 [Penicillium capsulatum]